MKLSQKVGKHNKWINKTKEAVMSDVRNWEYKTEHEKKGQRSKIYTTVKKDKTVWPGKKRRVEED